MTPPKRLLQELATLSAGYRAGSVPLPRLASRAEVLVEEMHTLLPAEDFARAMNCVYLVEEINAVVLDERRSPTESEKEAIERDLSLLERLISK